MNRHRDVVISLLLTGALCLALLLTDIAAVRTILALPLVFFLTGHLALLSLGVIFPAIEHSLTAICLSFAICIAGCFVLFGISTVVPAGVSALTPIGWMLWVSTVVIGLSAVIVARDLPSRLVILRLPPIRMAHALTIGLAVLIASAAWVRAIYDEANTREFTYTEFWFVPTSLGKLIVGIKNAESEALTYHVSITARDRVIAELHSIKLQPGQVWTHRVESRGKTEAKLYRGENSPVVYRRVSALAGNSD